ncbi:MAG: OmpA family protein [Magnetococcales bacterium]|nr:OmpA family protein [Magnetococcales bacterium]
MADKKCPVCKKGAPGWMVTFGDMMSLLLTFFVLLLSFAQLEIVKFKEVAGALQKAFSIRTVQQIIPMPTGTDMMAMEFTQEVILVKLKEKLQDVVDPLIQEGAAEIVDHPEGIRIAIDDAGIFATGTLHLRPDFEKLLDDMSPVLIKHPNMLYVTGHTGDQAPDPLSPFTNNWAVSVAKAGAIVDYLATRGGVDPTRLQARGMAEFQPRIRKQGGATGISDNRVMIEVSRETQAVFDNPVLKPEDLMGDAPGFIGENVPPARARNF